MYTVVIQKRTTGLPVTWLVLLQLFTGKMQKNVII